MRFWRVEDGGMDCFLVELIGDVADNVSTRARTDLLEFVFVVEIGSG